MYKELLEATDFTFINHSKVFFIIWLFNHKFFSCCIRIKDVRDTNYTAFRRQIRRNKQNTPIILD